MYFGDYIYEYGNIGYVIEDVVEFGCLLFDDNSDEIIFLVDYCKCYVYYCEDENL